jgi:predicted amidophosphoribosyltransferase
MEMKKMRKNGQNFCDVCGEQVDKSACYDGVAFGVFTTFDDVSTNPDVYDGPRKRKAMLLCASCNQKMLEKVVEMMNQQMDNLEKLDAANDFDYKPEMDACLGRMKRYNKRFSN